MTVVFEDDLTTIIHGKWQDHLDLIDAADVLVTDPPYGMDYQSNFPQAGPTEKVRGDTTTFERDSMLARWWDGGMGGGRLRRPAIVFGTWRVPRPEGVRQLVVWHKGDRPGMGDLSLPWGPSHEDIYILGGEGPGNWTGKRGPSVIRARTREGNATNSHTEHGHPTPKPVLLMQDLISHTVGKTIIDPFSGSGSTNVAARLLGRRSIGIEMERKYADAAARRIERIPRP